MGRTICRGLAACGADVVICYRNQKDFARQLCAEIEAEHHVRSWAKEVDVMDELSVKALHGEVASLAGKVDILVNTVAIPYAMTHVLEQKPEDYEIQFRSCVTQAVLMAQTFAPDMIERQYGRIIGINTECAMQMFENQSAYVAGKRGMDGVYRVLARELGPHNITVNQVAPGWTISDNCRHDDPNAANTGQDFPYISRVPLRRRGTDEDVANAVCFLASPLADFISGVFLPVCGGNVMPCI